MQEKVDLLPEQGAVLDHITVKVGFVDKKDDCLSYKAVPDTFTRSEVL